MIVDSATGIAQRCFVGEDGFRRCNFIIRNGLPRWTKSGKWWKFPAFTFAIFKRKKKEQTEVVKTETATISEKK